MIIKWLSTKYINQSDLLTLTVGCEKRSCLIISQKKKKELINMIMETKIVMIIIRTTKIGNNSKIWGREKSKTNNSSTKNISKSKNNNTNSNN